MGVLYVYITKRWSLVHNLLVQGETYLKSAVVQCGPTLKVCLHTLAALLHLHVTLHQYASRDTDRLLTRNRGVVKWNKNNCGVSAVQCAMSGGLGGAASVEPKRHTRTRSMSRQQPDACTEGRQAQYGRLCCAWRDNPGKKNVHRLDYVRTH